MPRATLGAKFCFSSLCNKNAGTAQQNAFRERLFTRKSALSAIFSYRLDN
jgi:hypothetical protein